MLAIHKPKEPKLLQFKHCFFNQVGNRAQWVGKVIEISSHESNSNEKEIDETVICAANEKRKTHREAGEVGEARTKRK